jgi:hypothetical protein
LNVPPPIVDSTRRGTEKNMTVRVGILTFHAANNFGAVLQTYATCRALEEFGCEPCVIDYRPSYFAAPPRPAGRRLLSMPTKVLRKLREGSFRTALGNVLRNRRFARFRRDFLPTTARVYWNAEQLRADPPDVDVCVCGSDQIWNVRLTDGRLDPSLFLDFAPRGVRRVAYAPSIGGFVFPEEYREAITALLKEFAALSGRENDLCTIIKQLAGRDAPMVLDPSLLVADYSPAIREPMRPPKRYIAVYPLDYSQPFVDSVQRVKTLLRLPVVNIGARPLPGADANRNSLGPSEWLGWMRRATFVCTNSFHGTAYSIILRRDFVTCPYLAHPVANARLATLLGQFGLGGRYIANAGELTDRTAAVQPVDYAAAEPLLQAAISRSRAYLKDAVLAARDATPERPSTA